MNTDPKFDYSPSGGRSAFWSDMSRWISTAHRAASTALANLDQRTIAGILDDAAAVLGDFGVDKRFCVMSFRPWQQCPRRRRPPAGCIARRHPPRARLPTVSPPAPQPNEHRTRQLPHHHQSMEVSTRARVQCPSRAMSILYHLRGSDCAARSLLVYTDQPDNFKQAIENHSADRVRAVTPGRPVGETRRLEHDPEKLAPHLMRGGYRFSEKIMLKQKYRAG